MSQRRDIPSLCFLVRLNCSYEGVIFVIIVLQLGDVMVDIASNIMLADERVLWMAQKEAKACTRIVQCLQRIATYRLANGAQVYSTVSPKFYIIQLLNLCSFCITNVFYFSFSTPQTSLWRPM